VSSLPLFKLSDAVFSDDGLYRYYLERRIADLAEIDYGWLCYLMLNPSTADHAKDDPTIRKCRGFAQRMGYGGLRIVNLYGYRTPYPKELREANKSGIDVVGPDNDRWIRHAFQNSQKVVVAWGDQGPRRERVGRITAIAAECKVTLHAIGTTKGGQPRHPLMVPYATPVTEWSMAA
jgi:hypothetical protein